MPVTPDVMGFARMRRAREIAITPPPPPEDSSPVDVAAPAPSLTPLGIFVAWKDSFPARTRGLDTEADVLRMAFENLPLEHHGWRRASTKARQVRPDFWVIEKTSASVTP